MIHVAGADLMDGTPIFDIKPYIAYADCRPDAFAGFDIRFTVYDSMLTVKEVQKDEH